MWEEKIQNASTTVFNSNSDYDGIIDQLETHFSDWWGAFLLYTLEALQVFREWGDDDKQLLVWAIAVEIASGNAEGMTLSQASSASAVPIETARLRLSELVAQNSCCKIHDRYSVSLPEKTWEKLQVQAERFANALLVSPSRVSPGSKKAGLSAYLRATLNYSANVRRNVARGAYVASVVAGMVEIESHVRSHLLKQGRRSVSRTEYNQIVEEFPDNKFHASRLAQLTGESMEKARNAIRYAETLGVITLFGHDLCAFNAKAARVPGDRQAYTRGVKEALAAFILSAPLRDHETEVVRHSFTVR